MLNIILPLTKVEEGEQRLVFGRAAACVPDRSGEIMDWDTGKAAIKEWSDSFAKATNGQSLGNLRFMHDAKRVVGKLVDINFDDAAQAVDVCGHIVEDDAWRLTREGCVTGFSIGGSYAKKWADTGSGLTKYTPRLAEISLVDRPCIPDATIVMIKADGSKEELRITGSQRTTVGWRPRTFAELSKSAPRTFAEMPGRPRTFGELEDLEKGTPLRARGFIRRTGEAVGLYPSTQRLKSSIKAGRAEARSVLEEIRAKDPDRYERHVRTGVVDQIQSFGGRLNANATGLKFLGRRVGAGVVGAAALGGAGYGVYRATRDKGND